MARKLTHKQRKFVKEYINNGGIAYRAALDAGYAPDTAKVDSHRMPNNPLIAEKINTVLDKKEADYITALRVTVADKAKILKDILDDIMSDTDTIQRRKGYRDAVKAIAELNKLSGHYSPNRSLSITVDATAERLEEARRKYEEY